MAHLSLSLDTTQVKGNTRYGTRSTWATLCIAFSFVLCLQFLVVRHWHFNFKQIDKLIPYQARMLYDPNTPTLSYSTAANSETDSKKIEDKCSPQFPKMPVNIGGSVPSTQYKNFNFASPPGSPSRVDAVSTSAYHAERPIVTVITPTNNPKYIDSTAKSLLSQTFQPFRWIIVNDHSTELSILNKYRRHGDQRVEVLDCAPSQEHPCGPSKARNEALKNVNTEFVLFLDDDDLLETTYLEKLVWMLKSNSEFSYANSFSVTFGAKNLLWDRTFYQSSLNENQQVITALVRTSALKTITKQWPIVFDEDMTKGGTGGAEDWMMWLKLKANELHGATIPEYLFWYRMKPQRRNWEFLKKRKATGNLRRTQETVRKNDDKFGPEKAAKLFPKLYEQGHKNPTLPNCKNAPSKSICNKDILNSVNFANVHSNLRDEVRPSCSPSKHIILVIPWMAMGGSDMVNVKLVRLLAEANWKITIVNSLSTSATSSTSSSLEFFRPILQQYTEDIFTLPHFLRVKDYGRFFLYLLKSRRANVMMMSNSFAGYNLLPYLKTHAPSSVVFADYVHMRQTSWKVGAYFEDDKDVQAGGFPRLSGLFSQYLDLSLFVSDDERQWVSQSMKLPKPEMNRHVVHYGIDTEHFRGTEDQKRLSRNKLGIADDAMCVLFVGRLVDQKRPDVLIKIFDKLTKTLHGEANVHLIIAGDGELQSKLKQYIAKNHLKSKVSMLGRVAREDMSSVMAAGDVIFLPSKMEGLAIALVEAMSMGLVPVVTNVGGHREIVSAENGCLLDRDDYDGMLNCLRKLALNPQMRQEMSQNAKMVVNRDFSYHSMKTHVLKHLNEATQRIQTGSQLMHSEKQRTEEELPKALDSIRKLDPSKSTIVSQLNTKNVPQRKSSFGKILAKNCGEDAAVMTEWISMMEDSVMCGSSQRAHQVIGKHIQKQCGQWCIFSIDDPDNLGWAFNGKCFTKFGNNPSHGCRKFTDLIDRVKNY